MLASSRLLSQAENSAEDGGADLEIKHGHQTDDNGPDDWAQLRLRQERARPPLPKKRREPGVALVKSVLLPLTARRHQSQFSIGLCALRFSGLKPVVALLQSALLPTTVRRPQIRSCTGFEGFKLKGFHE